MPIGHDANVPPGALAARGSASVPWDFGQRAGRAQVGAGLAWGARFAKVSRGAPGKNDHGCGQGAQDNGFKARAFTKLPWHTCRSRGSAGRWWGRLEAHGLHFFGRQLQLRHLGLARFDGVAPLVAGGGPNVLLPAVSARAAVGGGLAFVGGWGGLGHGGAREKTLFSVCLSHARLGSQASRSSRLRAITWVARRRSSSSRRSSARLAWDSSTVRGPAP